MIPCRYFSKTLILFGLLFFGTMCWDNETSAGELQVDWTDNSTNEDGFNIERKAGTSGTYAQAATVGANVTSYTDSTLVDGATYCYRIFAFNSGGNSPYSNEVCGAARPIAQSFALSVTKAGTGNGTVSSSPAGINCGGTCSGTYNSGTAVTLSASAAAGSIFAGWSGTGCSTGTVTMDAAKSCTATFNLQTFGLSIVKAGTGSGTVTSSPAGINCGSTCSGTYNSGTAVTLTATAAAGSTFSGWSGGGCSSNGATCTVNLTADTTVNATFTAQAVQMFTLTVAKPGTGNGTVTATGINCGADCTEALPSGDVQLTAAASAGSTFSGWSGGGCSSNGATCTVNLTADTTVNATFRLQNDTNQLATRIGIFRPSTGEWFLDLNGNGKWDDSADARLTSFPYDDGDLPIVGNWNADGTSSIGFFNPVSGTWKLDTNGNDQWDGCAVDTCVNSYGKAGDWPVIRKMNGIGSIIGTFSPGSITTINRRRSVKRGLWNFDLNGNSTMDACSVDECDTFGFGSERPIIGDWNGTGTENIGLFLNGYWYLDLNGNEKWDGYREDRLLTFGRRGDLPVVGDWDGTGVARIGVFRPSTGEWFLDLNGNGKLDNCTVDACLGPFGQEGDLPVVGKW